MRIKASPSCSFLGSGKDVIAVLSVSESGIPSMIIIIIAGSEMSLKLLIQSETLILVLQMGGLLGEMFFEWLLHFIQFVSLQRTDVYY
jgi:hypothetical protein